jgi:hypothetical protein
MAVLAGVSYQQNTSTYIGIGAGILFLIISILFVRYQINNRPPAVIPNTQNNNNNNNLNSNFNDSSSKLSGGSKKKKIFLNTANIYLLLIGLLIGYITSKVI